MAIKTFSSSFRTRDDVFDNITPNNMVQPKVSHPAGEWKPAAWLPVEWSGTASKDYFVMSSGKAVAIDASGRIVPAGLRLRVPDLTSALAADLASAMTLADTLDGTAGKTIAEALSQEFLSYTAADVTAKTVDITTGSAVTAAKTVTVIQFCQAVVEKGWVKEDDIETSNANTLSFSGQSLSNNDSVVLFGSASDTVSVADVMSQATQVIELFISECIGVCAYDIYSWAGDSPASLKYTNYQKQHLVQFITEAQMKVPQQGNLSTTTTGDLSGASQWNKAVHGAELPAGSTEVWISGTQLSQVSRYSDSSDEVLYVGSATNLAGIYLGAVELIPSNSGLTTGASTALAGTGAFATYAANKKNRIQDIKALGDYFFDYEVGILIAFEEAGNASPFATTSAITFYKYASAASAGHQHIYFVGRCNPGDHITIDSESNFTKSTSSSDVRIGRVLEIQQFPKSLMERVTTAWQGSSFDASMRMPGTATKGLPDNLTLAGQNGEVVGNRMVICNIRVL